MGIGSSKKNKSKRESHLFPNQTQKYDDEVVNRLRKELDDNPEMFLLNNIFMSMQFYKNFEREMEDLRKNQVSEREIELNKALAEHQKHCLLPDTVMECINERVRYRPCHGPKKFESEPLIPQRMFIVHDNIEILYEGETSEYSTVDGPVHKAVLERAEKPGYSQVRQVEFLDIKRQNNDDDSESEDEESDQKSLTSNSLQCTPPISPGPLTPGGKQRLFAKKSPDTSPAKNSDSQFTFAQTENSGGEIKPTSEVRRISLKDKIFRSKSFSLNSPKASLKVKPSSSVENLKNSGGQVDEYGYTTLRRLTTPKLLSEMQTTRNPSASSSVCSNCITEIKIRKILDDDSDSDDSLMENGKRRPPIKKKKEDFYDVKKYFNSTDFFSHFGDTFRRIYPLLGFSVDYFRNAMWQRGIVHCDFLDSNQNKIPYEVYPTLATSWPELALEWDLRSRPRIRDPTTNIIYQWPTEKMVKKIRSLQANVLPIGFLAKRGMNENDSLEWSLAFPAAERFMKTCMSHSQIRCYLFILALYKTFMEPPNTKLGLNPNHILTLIFWQCEKNYITWPEDRLGSKMLKILNHLYDHLAKGHLPDYFIRDRNLLESTPSQYLRISQANLHNIIERPVMHVLAAMRNLRYTSGTFFPVLNFKKLYNIIIRTDSLAIINPLLSVYIDNNTEHEQDDVNEFRENAVPFWNQVKKTEDREQKWKRELRKQIEREKKEQHENLKKIRRDSVDSINWQAPIPRLDSYRKRALLEFFIIHFLAVANKCYEYEAFSYALIILNHSHSLAILLGEEPSGEVEARPLKSKIADQIDKCRRALAETKSRVVSNRDTRTFSVKFNILDNHDLNMKKLQKSYNNTANNLNGGILNKNKNRPANIEIVSADIHNVDTVTPTSKISTPSHKSIILENNESWDTSTDL